MLEDREPSVVPHSVAQSLGYRCLRLRGHIELSPRDQYRCEACIRQRLPHRSNCPGIDGVYRVVKDHDPILGHQLLGEKRIGSHTLIVVSTIDVYETECLRAELVSAESRRGYREYFRVDPVVGAVERQKIRQCRLADTELCS